jgi:hypothetical protein
MVSASTTKNVNIVLGAGHLCAALGVYIVLVLNDGGWTSPVTLSYNTWNKSDDDTFRISTSALRLTDDFYPGYVLIFCSIFSGLHHVAAVLDKEYHAKIEGGFAGYRWVDYALSAPLMLVVNELLWVAPPDVNTLVLVASVQMLIVLAGGAAPEWWWALGTAPPGWDAQNWIAGAFFASTVPFVWLWARYAWVLDLGVNDSNAKVPDFVLIILALLATSFAAFPIVFGAKLLAPSEAKRNLRFEARFMLLSAFAKIPLLSFFATGLVARRTRVSADANASIPSDEDSDVGLIAVGIATGIVVLATSALFALDPEPHTLRHVWFPWGSRTLSKTQSNNVK